MYTITIHFFRTHKNNDYVYVGKKAYHFIVDKEQAEKINKNNSTNGVPSVILISPDSNENKKKIPALVTSVTPSTKTDTETYAQDNQKDPLYVQKFPAQEKVYKKLVIVHPDDVSDFLIKQVENYKPEIKEKSNPKIKKQVPKKRKVLKLKPGTIRIKIKK